MIVRRRLGWQQLLFIALSIVAFSSVWALVVYSLNDVPMNALCRTIEIDLRSMLGETDLPEPEQPAAGFILY